MADDAWGKGDSTIYRSVIIAHNCSGAIGGGIIDCNCFGGRVTESNGKCFGGNTTIPFDFADIGNTNGGATIIVGNIDGSSTRGTDRVSSWISSV